MQPQSKTSIIIPSIIGLIIVAAVIFGIYFFITTPKSQNQNTPGTVDKVTLYYVAVDDGGKSGPMIGCNDSLVGVTVPITPTQAPLRAALEKLFEGKDQFIGQSGLMNSLYQSHLAVDSATVVNGVATVKLSGSVMLGGVCDDPRFVNQIKQTALQFPTVTSAVITINNKPLESYLSEK